MSIEFKIHLRNEKIRLMYQLQIDFKKDFDIELPHGAGFTKSDFFHFVAVDGKKYVHKEAMLFHLTNGGTYLLGKKNPDFFSISTDAKEREKVNSIASRMFDFFRYDINNHPLFPKFLFETDYFFVFNFYQEDEWEPLDQLTLEDSIYIKRTFIPHYKNTKEVVTPFFSQMKRKLFRSKSNGNIVMVDLKCLDFRSISSLAILMYNGRVNDLYLLERRFVTRKYILKPYAMDYPVQYANLIRYY